MPLQVVCVGTFGEKARARRSSSVSSPAFENIASTVQWVRDAGGRDLVRTSPALKGGNGG